jgi:predicted nucleotidyltransferase
MRPLLAARWIARTQAAPPIEFARLMTELDGKHDVKAAVGALLEKKRVTAELGLAESVPALNDFIEAELDGDVEEAPDKPRSPEVIELLNDIFHQSILSQ